VLERGRELLVEVVDAAGRAVGDCAALVAIGPRTLMPTGPYDRGRMRFENAPSGAGKLHVELGGLEFTTPFDAAAHEVRCVLPETGTVEFTVDPTRVDGDVLVTAGERVTRVIP